MSLIGLVLVGLLPNNRAHAADIQFRRWLDGTMTASCITDGGEVKAILSSQSVEFANLPADAQFTLHYIKNGADSVDGPYTVEQTSGNKTYGSFAQAFPSYPFTFEFRTDTIIDGEVVYQSSIIVNCSGDTGSSPATIVNEDQVVRYRRWLDNDKTLTCVTVGGTVQVRLNNQDVEFNSLPTDAEYTLNYIKNGHTSIDGPYTVEQTNGTRHYGAFAQGFTAYPLTFEFRLDTLIDGKVVYRSSVSISCSGDSAGPVSVSPENHIGPASTHHDSGGGSDGSCANPLTDGAVQGRLVAATTALFSPSADALTTIVLNGGSAWYVTAAQNGYYKLWVACEATPLWVPASAMTPNQDPPWNGAPLPASGG